MPGTFATDDELLAIARSIAEVGHGVFQTATHHPEVPESFSWMRAVAQITGQPVVFNLNQPDYAPDLWREDLRLLEESQAEGLNILAQVSGRPVGILESWSATVNPFMLCPTWGLIGQLPEAERLEHLARPDVRAALTTEAPAVWSDFIASITRSWDKLYPFSGEADYEPDPAATCAGSPPPGGRAGRGRLRPDDVGEREGLLYYPLFNYSNHNLDHLRELHQHPHTRMGLADAGAHCGTIADGGMPTFMLQFWARDRARGDQMPVEWLVHRQTRQTAEMYGLHDRGLLAPGMRADVNVIDLDGLAVELPHLVDDLPTGAKRYVQRAEGYGATVCRGAVTVLDDQFTGETPGRLIRGRRATLADLAYRDVGHAVGVPSASHTAAATAAITASEPLTAGRSSASTSISIVGVSTARTTPKDRMVRSWISPVSGSTAIDSLRTSPSPMCAAPVQYERSVVSSSGSPARTCTWIVPSAATKQVASPPVGSAIQPTSPRRSEQHGRLEPTGAANGSRRRRTDHVDLLDRDIGGDPRDGLDDPGRAGARSRPVPSAFIPPAIGALRPVAHDVLAGEQHAHRAAVLVGQSAGHLTDFGLEFPPNAPPLPNSDAGSPPGSHQDASVSR